MRTDARLIRWFREILAEEGLLNLAEFDEPGFLDELPLYSRISQLEFLFERSVETGRTNDQILIDFGLDYLDLVLREIHPGGSILAALTIVKPGPGEPIVPSLFVCHGQVEERIKGRLLLDEPESEFAADVGKWLNSADRKLFQILEDRRTVPEEIRVFVGPRSPSNLLSVTIDEMKAEFPATADPVEAGS